MMAKPRISLKSRALRYLSMREHSRLELGRKLQRYAEDGDDVDALLDWLEGEKFLSQTRFSESLIHRRAARFGNNRIVSELQSHGIAGEALTGLKQKLQIDELARARDVWQRKFGKPAADSAERGKQMRFMQQRGFSGRAIQAAMRTRPDEDDFPTSFDDN
ncbi:regulatory protein [Actimicrobium sp. GrIS 1.19]|nr:regulatory protein [Actimicrobium sp. GrIS 1.19]